jgi:hypothetical protein
LIKLISILSSHPPRLTPSQCQPLCFPLSSGNSLVWCLQVTAESSVGGHMVQRLRQQTERERERERNRMIFQFFIYNMTDSCPQPDKTTPLDWWKWSGDSWTQTNCSALRTRLDLTGRILKILWTPGFSPVPEQPTKWAM